MSDRESAFVARYIWMVQNLAGVGLQSGAERMFEKLLARPNDPGLLPEEIDLETGRFMGNFPQALSHIALINVPGCSGLTNRLETFMRHLKRFLGRDYPCL